jgi:hypothetical protein
MQHTFTSLSQIKDAYSSQNNDEYDSFVRDAEGYVEITIRKGLEYDGRIIWDSFF